MKVLAVVHGANCPSGSFGDLVEERGHELETWAIGSGAPEPPLDEHSAVMLIGGSMHSDQEEYHPWLLEDDAFIRRLLARRVPLLGVCLGAQLVAKAGGGRVYRLDQPEIGWFDVELTDEAARDPVFAGLPRRFAAFEWHCFAFDVPSGIAPLARSRACPQAFRLGEAAWAVQFHPEVTREIAASWVNEEPEEASGGAEAFLAETERHIDAWVRFGESLCGAFVETAERVAIPA